MNLITMRQIITNKRTFVKKTERLGQLWTVMAAGIDHLELCSVQKSISWNLTQIIQWRNSKGRGWLSSNVFGFENIQKFYCNLFGRWIPHGGQGMCMWSSLMQFALYQLFCSIFELDLIQVYRLYHKVISHCSIAIGTRLIKEYHPCNKWPFLS